MESAKPSPSTCAADNGPESYDEEAIDPREYAILSLLTRGWHSAAELLDALELRGVDPSSLRADLDDLVRKGVLARAVTEDGQTQFGLAHRSGRRAERSREDEPCTPGQFDLPVSAP